MPKDMGPPAIPGKSSGGVIMPPVYELRLSAAPHEHPAGISGHEHKSFSRWENHKNRYKEDIHPLTNTALGTLKAWTQILTLPKIPLCDSRNPSPGTPTAFQQ